MRILERILEDDSRRTLLAIRYAEWHSHYASRSYASEETSFDIRIYLFCTFERPSKTCASRARRPSGRRCTVLSFTNRSQERRSQFCATSMSRMSSIAGAFRLPYTANDRYPDARIMDVSVARRTPRMRRIIVMRETAAGDGVVCPALAENH